MSLRAVLWVLSAFFSAIVALMYATATRARHPPENAPPVAEALARRVHNTEVAVARALGMREPVEVTLPVLEADAGARGHASYTLSLGAETCAAVVVSVHGYHRIERLGLQHRAEGAERVSVMPPALVVAREPMGVTGQLQWCTHAPAELVMVLETRNLSPMLPPPVRGGTAIVTVLRGPSAEVGGVAALNRGTFSPEGLVGLGEGAALDRAASLEGPSVGGLALPLRPGAARLVPSTAVTYRALLNSVQQRDDEPVHPRVEPEVVPGAWFTTGLPLEFSIVEQQASRGQTLPPVHDAVVQTGDRAFSRVLAVVDPRQLGRGCVRLGFVRHAVGLRARLARYDRASGGETEVPMHENVAGLRLCPSEGPTVFTTDTQDALVWSLFVQREP
ncbi:MAG: hypothetical protein JNK72_06360 [Myxococcales bacterium]|nr:hypothetical protein [Myxococcales bacterium]